MTKELALSIIGHEDGEDIGDLWENWFFQLKQKILNSRKQSNVLQLRVRLAEQAVEMYDCLFEKCVDTVSNNSVIDFSQIPVKDVFSCYESFMADLHLKMINTTDPVGLLGLLKTLIKQIKKYESFILELGDKLTVKDNGDASTTVIDPVELKRELQNNIDEPVNSLTVEAIKPENLNNLAHGFPKLIAEYSRIKRIKC